MDSDGRYTCAAGHKCHQTYTEPGKIIQWCSEHLPEPETE